MVAYFITINFYVRNSVDETTLDRVAFLRELIIIRDSSLTLSGLLSYYMVIQSSSKVFREYFSDLLLRVKAQ